MDDLISKAEVLKIFERLVVDMSTDYFSSTNYGIPYEDGFDAIMELTPVDSWIPCKERLPSDDYESDVYCCDIYGNQMVGSPMKDDYSKTGFSASNLESCMCDCIAWMPTFAPYREKNK